MQRKLRQFAWILSLAVGSSNFGTLPIAAQQHHSSGPTIGQSSQSRENEREREKEREREREREREKEREKHKNHDKNHDRDHGHDKSPSHGMR